MNPVGKRGLKVLTEKELRYSLSLTSLVRANRGSVLFGDNNENGNDKIEFAYDPKNMSVLKSKLREKDLLVRWSDIEFEKSIGRNETAEVYIGYLRGNPTEKSGEVCTEIPRGAKQHVVIKHFFFDMKNVGVLDDIYREICILYTVAHPHIVQFCGASLDFQEGNMLYICTALASGGSLMDYLSRSHTDGKGLINYFNSENSQDLLPEICTRYRLSAQLLDAVAYLHSFDPPLVHLDIKPVNVLIDIDSNGLVNSKLCDFGVTRMINDIRANIAGSPRYMSPELLAIAVVRDNLTLDEHNGYSLDRDKGTHCLSEEITHNGDRVADDLQIKSQKSYHTVTSDDEDCNITESECVINQEWLIFIYEKCYEWINNIVLTEKIDIWSVGCVINEIFGASIPYSKASTVENLCEMMILRKLRPVISSTGSLRPIIKACISFDPKDRPRARNLCRHIVRSHSRDLESLRNQHDV